MRNDRFIKPSLIEPGDVITVALRPVRGVRVTRTGQVSHRVDNGNTRLWVNEQNAILVSWDEKENRDVSIILHSRLEKPQEELFKENINGEFVL